MVTARAGGAALAAATRRPRPRPTRKMSAAGGQIAIEIVSDTKRAKSIQALETRKRTLSLERLSDLPPMAKPNRAAQDSESCRGITLVFCVTALLVGFAHLPGPPFAHSPFRGTVLICLYVVALLGIVCLLGLLFDDPGVLHRSKKACFPLPDKVRARMEANKSLDGLYNVPVKGTGIYCVRCCVWRPERRTDIHHCSVCQRCIRWHDHHCGVFGRCIAGKPMDLTAGTMRWYCGIWICLFLGIIACVIGVLTGAQ